MRVDPGAHGSASERDPRQLVDRSLRAPDRFLDLPGVALELLAEPDRGRVLEVSAARLDDRPEFLALGLERAREPLEGWDELVLDRHRRSKLDRGRDHVVGGLA